MLLGSLPGGTKCQNIGYRQFRSSGIKYLLEVVADLLNTSVMNRKKTEEV